jgi:alpha-beta hydrolase superfamily lysophospholipase
MDHRGHGISKKPKRLPQLDDYLGDIYLLMNKVDTSLPHFLYGYSLGAAFVLYYVVKYFNTKKNPNQRLDGLILISPIFKPPAMKSSFRKSFDLVLSKVAPKSKTTTGIKEKHLYRSSVAPEQYQKAK